MTRKNPLGGPLSHRALLDPITGYMALFTLAASVALPFPGFGIDVCAVHALTGLPCPGCGLTRAFISLSAGDVSTAVGANPFVLLLYPLFATLAGLLLLPKGAHARAMAWLDARGASIGKGYQLAFVAFAGFGALRFAYFALSGETFP